LDIQEQEATSTTMPMLRIWMYIIYKPNKTRLLVLSQYV